MIENMPYTIEKEQEDLELKSAEEKEQILGRLYCFIIRSQYSLHPICPSVPYQPLTGKHNTIQCSYFDEKLSL